MTLEETLKAYLFPSYLPGIRKISEKGQQNSKARLDAMKKGVPYSGPETLPEDEAIRQQNRRRVLPYLPTYIRRWLTIAAILWGTSMLAGQAGVFVIDLLLSIAALASTIFSYGLIWFQRDLKKLEGVPK